MKECERSWILWTTVLLIVSIFLMYIFIITQAKSTIPLLFIHFNIGIIVMFMYSIISSRKVRKMETVWPKKGEECFCYIYHLEQGDNGSVVFYVVAHLESKNINQILKYQSFTNLKLSCNQVVKGYYYKNRVVLDKKSVDIRDLPQNIIDAFELNDENII